MSARALVGLALLTGAAGTPQAQQAPAPAEPTAAREPVTAQETLKREQQAQEDPLAEQLSQPETDWDQRPNELSAYGSLRLRYRVTEGEGLFGDGGTRAGAAGRYQVRPQVWLTGRAEIGFNVLDELDALLSPSSQSSNITSGDSVFLRLLYAGVESPIGSLTFGKNWSAYYQVSKWTDNFQGAGGSASGTYNAGTDGGETGTGRADRTLQGRWVLDPKRLGLGLRPAQASLQVQYDEPVPQVEGANYAAAVGASFVWDNEDGSSIGLAYNRAFVSSGETALLQAAGIDGDAQALLGGMRWISARWNVATVVARLLNHETTNAYQYFDGWGWEVYAQYQATQRIFLVGGWNWLKPDNGQPQAGAFELRYALLEVRYTLRDFTRMLYANVRLDAGRDADGTPQPNVFTVGIRFDLP
jgi:predicted porin